MAAGQRRRIKDIPLGLLLIFVSLTSMVNPDRPRNVIGSRLSIVVAASIIRLRILSAVSVAAVVSMGNALSNAVTSSGIACE